MRGSNTIEFSPRRLFLIASFGRAADAVVPTHRADPAYYMHAYRRRRADVNYYVQRARSAVGSALEYGEGR